MSDEDDRTKAEKDFARDREWVEKTAAAKLMLETAMADLHQKHKGDEEKMRREFKRLIRPLQE